MDSKGNLCEYRLKTNRYLEPNPSNVHSCVLKRDKDILELDNLSRSLGCRAKQLQQGNNTSYHL